MLGIVGKDWSDRYSQLISERGIDLAGAELVVAETVHANCDTLSKASASVTVGGLSLDVLGRVQMQQIEIRCKTFMRWLLVE